MEKIHLIVTGGTIDSHWDGKKDTAVPNSRSVIFDYLQSLKLYTEIEKTELFLKDSREITEADRGKILEAVNSSSCNKILITHGTYTMPETAKYLHAKLEKNNKVVVLTGSMTPMYGFTDSDGPFNLGFALAKFETLSEGVYLIMNGQVFTAQEVRST
jgi:L-asparaginase